MILSLYIVSPVSYVSVKHIAAYIIWFCSSSHACTTVKTSCVHVVIGRLIYTTSTFHQCSQPVSQRPILDDELDEQLLVSKSAVIYHDARMESNHSDCSAAPTTLRRHLSTCLSLLDLLWPTASVVVVVSLLNDILLLSEDLPIGAGGRQRYAALLTDPGSGCTRDGWRAALLAGERARAAVGR